MRHCRKRFEKSLTGKVGTWHTSQSLYSPSEKTVAWGEFCYECLDWYAGIEYVHSWWRFLETFWIETSHGGVVFSFIKIILTKGRPESSNREGCGRRAVRWIWFHHTHLKVSTFNKLSSLKMREYSRKRAFRNHNFHQSKLVFKQMILWGISTRIACTVLRFP